MTNSEFVVHAYITTSNCGGIEIMLNRSNDGAYYRFNYGQDDLENEVIYEAEIEYDNTEEGSTYLMHKPEDDKSTWRMIKLNEAIRTNL